MSRGVKEKPSGQNDLLIPGLPDEIALICIARVPRSYHRTASAVCQSWRKLIQGCVFSKVRQDLSLADEWLYWWAGIGNVWRCFDPSTQTWSKLPPMPDGNRAPIEQSFETLDGKLFAVGGHPPSSNPYDKITVSCKTVTYFDARSHCWKRAADLNIARAGCRLAVLNNKLYAFGGCTEGSKETPTGEVYDPITNRWKFVSSLESPVFLFSGVTMEGKFYAMGSDLDADLDSDELVGFVYDPQKDQWESMEDGLSGGWRAQSTILNGRLYTAGDDYVAGNLENGYIRHIDQVIQVYNPSKNAWEVVEEFWWQGADMSIMESMKLASFCGKLCIVSVDPNREEDKYSTIRMVMLEVNESAEGFTYTAICKDEFYEPFEEGRVPRDTLKSIHTISL